MVLSCGKWQIQRRSGIEIEEGMDAAIEFRVGFFAQLFRGDRAHPGHDPHAQDDVDRVGDFVTDLGQGRLGRSHDVRHDEHRPPAHRAFQHAVQFAVGLGRIGPIVGRAGFLLPSACR